MDVFLETERLALRRFTEADLDNLFDLDSDPAVMRFLTGGKPTPRAVIESEILPRFLQSYESSDCLGYWAAVDKASGEFLGWFGLMPGEGGSASDLLLGYRLRRSAWRKGYATEGALALIGKAFTELGVQGIRATTFEDNLASIRVMEKVGMRLLRRFRMTPELIAGERTFHADPDDLWEGDDVEYALDRSDWERLRQIEAERLGAR